MKVRSALLTEMSGKIGGAVASRARGDIQYFRKLVTPTNPNTSMQKAARDAIASAATLWRTTLTEAQQEAWWDEATGAQTGQALFTRTNQPLIFAANSTRTTLQGGLTAIRGAWLNVPAGFSPSTPFTAPSSIVIDDSANTISISGLNVDDPWNANADTDPDQGGILFVYLSHQQNASRLSRQHPFQLARAVGFGAPAAALAAPIDLASIGMTTQTGKVIYVKLRVSAQNGGMSTDYIQRVTVTT